MCTLTEGIISPSLMMHLDISILLFKVSRKRLWRKSNWFRPLVSLLNQSGLLSQYIKAWFSYIATITDCRIKERNGLSINFTVVKPPVKYNTHCLSSYGWWVMEIKMIFIFLIGSIVVRVSVGHWVICLTESSTDTISITFFIFRSATVAMYAYIKGAERSADLKISNSALLSLNHHNFSY